METGHEVICLATRARSDLHSRAALHVGMWAPAQGRRVPSVPSVPLIDGLSGEMKRLSLCGKSISHGVRVKLSHRPVPPFRGRNLLNIKVL